jgi:hypothetical protein
MNSAAGAKIGRADFWLAFFDLDLEPALPSVLQI